MGFLNFINDFEYKFSIKYPSEWKKVEKKMETILAFLSPLEDKSDKFIENLSIIIRDIYVEPINLEECIQFELNQLKQAILNFRLIKKTKTKLANIRAYKIIFTGKRQDINVKIMQYYAIKNKMIYLITYTSEYDKYYKFLKLIKKMIGSFKFI